MALLDDSIQEILLAEPGDALWAEVANGTKAIEDILDLKAIRLLIESEHEEYCEENVICPKCLAKLEPVYARCGAWGRLETFIEDYTCPNGHN